MFEVYDTMAALGLWDQNIAESTSLVVGSILVLALGLDAASEKQQPAQTSQLVSVLCDSGGPRAFLFLRVGYYNN